eukprot:COSAG01_NODE_12272_length_1769_cov_1.501198_4_plen_179_part_01
MALHGVIGYRSQAHPEVVASILRATPALEKKAVGELFGEPDDASLALLRTFLGCAIGSPCLGVCTHCDPIMCRVVLTSGAGCRCGRPLCTARSFDFAQLTFDVAIRVFLESFRLPGEAQKIDRIMEAFASQYFQSACQGRDTNVFADQDAAFVLSFSLIRLCAQKTPPPPHAPQPTVPN